MAFVFVLLHVKIHKHVFSIVFVLLFGRDNFKTALRRAITLDILSRQFNSMEDIMFLIVKSRGQNVRI